MFQGIENFIGVWTQPFEVIIVNDGSRDDTEALIRQHAVFQANLPNIVLLSQVNTGKGGAIKNGVAHAKGNYILTLDADMATPPAELILWLKKWDNAPKPKTIYIGSREHKDSVITKKGNRKFVGNIFNLITRIVSPLRIRDTQCGFKFYPAAEAKHLFASLKTLGWAHDVEILYKAYLDGFQIVEMPLDWHAVEGSKINVIRDGFKMFTELLVIVITTKLTYKAQRTN